MRVVIVPIQEGRIADWKGSVKDWVLVNEDAPSIGEDVSTRGRSNGLPLVNGIMD